jgi:arsenate reductase-like glutaredoxin family protein
MDTIAELFRRNILAKPYSDEELTEVVKELRERRRQLMLEKEAKAKERKRKAAAAAAERAARKRDPRQLDLEALAVSAGDTEKDAPQH